MMVYQILLQLAINMTFYFDGSWFTNAQASLWSPHIALEVTKMPLAICQICQCCAKCIRHINVLGVSNMYSECAYANAVVLISCPR